MSSREQFEAWHKGLKTMLIAAGEPAAARHCENLKVVYENAWIASREALVIELPGQEKFTNWGRYSEWRIQKIAELEAAGVRVTR